MTPLSAIHPAMRAYGITPRELIAPAELSLQPPSTGGAPGIGQAQQPNESAFSNILGRFVEEVNGKQMAAADLVANLQSGGDVSLHQAVIAMEEASVSFQLMVEVRNKLLEAYQELMRMQV
jgi:flagellar hook-basal body complex protein FliE